MQVTLVTLEQHSCYKQTTNVKFFKWKGF